jgi:hypothetical protein
MSIFIFDDDDERLPITWQGLDYNKAFVQAGSGIEELPYGIFTDTVGFNTPANFQSEVHPEIYKHGGGVEYYNPRTGSRVLNIQTYCRARTLGQLGAYIQRIQRDFSPLHLQWEHTASWPTPNGRPAWTDPWEADSQPLQFTMMNDASLDSTLEAVFPDDKVLLEYQVAPLSLPDPLVSATQTGFGAALDLSFLLLDGGRSQARSVSNSTGTTQSDIIQLWGNVPAWPLIKFSMDTGAGSATLTLTVSGGSGIGYTPAAMVFDMSGYSGTEDIVVNVRDRKVYVDGTLDMSILTSGDWPVVPPAGSSTLTFTWTNTTNTTGHETQWFETLAA